MDLGVGPVVIQHPQVMVDPWGFGVGVHPFVGALDWDFALVHLEAFALVVALVAVVVVAAAAVVVAVVVAFVELVLALELKSLVVEALMGVVQPVDLQALDLWSLHFVVVHVFLALTNLQVTKAVPKIKQNYQNLAFITFKMVITSCF